jgi:ribonucleotide reductase alpha subunit
MNKELINYFKGDELAASVWLSKYANEGETTPDDMHKRMAKEFARIEDKYENQKKVTGDLSKYGSTRNKLTEESIFDLFKDFKYIVPQGSVMATLGTNITASLSNCFVIGQPKDSYGGILQKDEQLVQLMKRRGGVGLDISTLRPNGTLVKNSAKSSTGAVSFMNRFSNSTREVAQGGRRGALMISISINHPDVMDFILIKRDLTKVTGANISIKLNNSFMEAVKKDDDYILTFPCDFAGLDAHQEMIKDLPYDALTTIEGGEVYIKKIKAKQYWDEIINSAHSVAEPGLMFEDNHINYSPDGVYEQYRGVTTNPCFTGDMKLLTPLGYRPFKELAGEVYFEAINKNGDIVPAKAWSNGLKETLVLRLSNGKHITCTPDHRFLNTSGEEVQAKDTLKIKIMPFFTINQEVSEYVKYGFIQGDGCTGRLSSMFHKGLEVNFGEKDEDVAELFDTKIGKQYMLEYNEILKILEFSSEPLPSRNFPKKYEEFSEKQKLQFLKGLYSANGSVIKAGRVALKTTCKELADYLHSTLNVLSGYKARPYITTNKEKEVTFSNGNYICKESYDINIGTLEGILWFASNIGFVQNYKKESLRELILKKAPTVLSIGNTREKEVFDFSLEDDTHWGVVEGVIAHNCGEIFMQPYDSCRLMVNRLDSYVVNPFTKDSYFDFDLFYKHNYETMVLSDNLVDLEIEYVDKIINKIKKDSEESEVKRVELELWEKVKRVAMSGRRTGLGVTALGDCFAALNLKYDSDEALQLTEKIFRKKMESELDCTTDLAILRGTFEGWDAELEKV